jgi:pSer/pThr/pTyr-binding forkhead associated (FHA) protein
MNQDINSPIRLRLQLVEERTDILEYIITDQAVIGRVGDDQDNKPEIDLSAYTGYQLGLSRRHVLLRLNDGLLEAQDLDSRNGTFVNGYRLAPHKWTQIADQDEMRLGRLVMILHIEALGEQ